MLTKVILDGALGAKFGRIWELEVDSPAEAVRLIDANIPGFRIWIREHVYKYAQYTVRCEYEGGGEEFLSDETFGLLRKLKSIRFTPVIEGSGNATKILVGAVLIAMAYPTGGATLSAGASMMMSAGASMMLGGIIGMLSPQIVKEPDQSGQNLSSHYFSGAVNTTQQGNPVQLIYGRVLVGSQVVSARMDIDQETTFA